MIAVLRERKLLNYIMDPSYMKRPEPATADKPTEDEKRKQEDWDYRDGQARTQLELSIGDSEMVHLLNTTSAKEMWDALVAVKEP